MNEKVLPWVDSHCHLEMLKGDIEEILSAARENGLPFCISIGTGISANRKIIDLCGRYQDVYGTLGFHPHYASGLAYDHLDWMRDTIRSNRSIVAVGECGFDFHYNRSSREDQLEAFSVQLDLAVETGVPVVIHSREADKETRDILEGYRGKNLKGVVHCFTSTVEQAKYLLDFGFYLSFNGISTYPQAEEVRKVLACTPIDRILLETDAPYLSPEPFRGKPNVPGNVAVSGRYIAKFLDYSQSDLAEQTLHNTLKLFDRISYEC